MPPRRKLETPRPPRKPSRKGVAASPPGGSSPLPGVAFGPEVCNDLAAAEQREWLITNGLGGFASSTVAGSATRRYHGLLFAALNPPAGRTQLVAGLDEIAHLDGRYYELATHRWLSGALAPQGYRLLESFRLEGSVPVWAFRIGAARFEKRIWMQHGENTTYVRYALAESQLPIALELKVLVNYRDFHSATHAGFPPNEWRMQLDPIDQGLRVTAFAGAVPFYIRGQLRSQADETVVQLACEPQHVWYRDFCFSVERERGLDDHEDQLYAARFRAQLDPGASLSLAFSTNPDASLDTAIALSQEQQRLSQIVTAAPTSSSASSTFSTFLASLLLAADQFLVSRPLPGQSDGKSVIAGYHWFSDWGRDTMLSLPGLALSAGRPEIARQILLAFAQFVDRGMLPNNFPDSGAKPEYNTIDATLWYFEAIRQYHEVTQDAGTLRQLFPVLEQIISAHVAGTRYNIHVDPEDGMLYGGGPGVQLTWMDAKVGDWVVTPRTGKPVEINVLWLNALDAMSAFASSLGAHAGDYSSLAARARASFAKFWNPQRNCCFDVLDAPGIGNDAALRPNQIFAVSLVNSPLTPAQQKSVVDICTAHLLTPYGLRSLAPGEPGYIGHYDGGPRERDAGYHQGTVWAWLIGPFVEAHIRVYSDRAAARAFLEPLASLLVSGSSAAFGSGSFGVGSLPEIFDADPPHSPRGCIAQAWSIAELLRVARLLA